MYRDQNLNQFHLSAPMIAHGRGEKRALESWELWKHRNACVFDKIRPDARSVVQSIANEGHLWCIAGASALQDFILRARS